MYQVLRPRMWWTWSLLHSTLTQWRRLERLQSRLPFLSHMGRGQLKMSLCRSAMAFFRLTASVTKSRFVEAWSYVYPVGWNGDVCAFLSIETIKLGLEELILLSSNVCFAVFSTVIWFVRGLFGYCKFSVVIIIMKWFRYGVSFAWTCRQVKFRLLLLSSGEGYTVRGISVVKEILIWSMSVQQVYTTVTHFDWFAWIDSRYSTLE